MSAATTDTQVRDYLSAVERFLDDLPADERRELLEDLEEHLTEVAAEDDGSLRDRLGPPDAYAAELRASAGLPPHVATAELTAVERLRWSLRASPLGALALSAPVRAVRGYLPELRPAWWVVRGYLAAVVIGAMWPSDPSGGCRGRTSAAAPSSGRSSSSHASGCPSSPVVRPRDVSGWALWRSRRTSRSS